MTPGILRRVGSAVAYLSRNADRYFVFFHAVIGS